MSEGARFEQAFPFQNDVLALPVVDLDAAASWYAAHFGMAEVERRTDPVPAVVMERDGVRIGFAINGEDPEQDGAAVVVRGIAKLKSDLESRGTETANWRIDERNGERFQVFFVRAPDGLCYYFHEKL